MEIFKIFFSKPSAKDVAKDRLKLILIHDRASISPDILDKIRDEIFNVLSKYVEIDSDDLDIRMTQVDNDNNESSPALIANIPIKNLKSRV